LRKKLQSNFFALMEKEEADSMAFFLTFLPGRKRHSTKA
jgi:hypothetical protein